MNFRIQEHLQAFVQTPLNLASAPCDYWFNYNWYDLTRIEEVGNTGFWTSYANPQDEIVSFNFCEKLNAKDTEVEPLSCPDLNLYAVEHSKPT